MNAQYRIAILVHQGEELDRGAEVDFIAVRCNDYNHPSYLAARQTDDERCCLCERKHQPPRLTLIKGGRS